MAASSPESLVDQQPGSADAAKREHIAALTGLRGFAALVVLMSHTAAISPHPWFGLHTYGPIALFVLSGFLLFQPWSRWMMGLSGRPSIRDFARRRLWRLFPPFLVLLGVLWLVYPQSRPDGMSSALRWMTMTSNYVAGESIRPGLQHVWSLGTELSWYVVLPLVGLLAGFLARQYALRPVHVMAAIVVLMLVLTIAWRAYVGTTDNIAHQMTFRLHFPYFAICFFGGAFISHLRLEHLSGRSQSILVDVVKGRPGWVLGLAITAGVLGASRFGGPWGYEVSTQAEINFRGSMMITMGLLLLAGVAMSPTGSIFSRIFGNKPAVAVGRWSYGLYLWHFPVLTLLVREIGRPEAFLSFVWYALLVASISIPLGAATYKFIELPSIAISRARSGAAKPRRQQRQTAAR